MKHHISIIAALVLFFGAMPTAISQEGALEPDAQVWFSTKQVGFILGGQSGGGHLKFDGEDYVFKLSGLKVGAVLGIKNMKASGHVFGLTKIEDFPGKYTETQAQLTVLIGGGGLWLENSKGVKMHLDTNNTGADFSLTAGGVTITMGAM